MKSVRLKKFVIILVAIVVLVMAAALVVPKLIDPNQYRHLIISQIEKAVGGKVSLGRITWGIAHGIWFEVDGFSVTGATAFPGDLDLNYIYANVSASRLLTKKVVVKKLLLERPMVLVRLEPRSPENGKKAKMLSPAVETSSESPPMPLGILVQKLSVKEGQVTLEDSLSLPGQKIVRVFTDVDMEARELIPGKEMAFQVALRDKAKSGLGSLKAQGSFSGLTEALTIENPKLKFNATLSSLNTDAIKPYLRKSPLARRIGGRVSLELNYEGDLGDHARAKGLFDLSQFTYEDPSLWKRKMPGGETKIRYQVMLGPDDLTMEKLSVELGNLYLSGHAMVKGWRTEPVIKNAVFSSSDLPLVDLIPLIPWGKLGKTGKVIREVLEGGGELTIEKATVPEINPAKPPSTLDALLSGVKVTAWVSGVSLRPTPNLPKVENIKGTLRLDKGIGEVEGLTGQAGPVSLPAITAKITDLLEKPKVKAHLKGQLKVGKNTDKAVVKLLRAHGIEEVVGTADVDLALQLDSARPEDFRLAGKADLRGFQVGTSLVPALFKGLSADVALTHRAANISKLSTTVVVPAVADSPGGQFTLVLNGRVEDWRQQPILTLRRLTTSEVSLPSIVPLVPWDKLGESAEFIKATLLAGGKVTIENLAFSNLDPQKPPKDPKSLVSMIKGAMSFADIAVRPKPLFPKLEGITGRLSLAKGIVNATKVQARVGPLTLPPMDIRGTNITNQTRVWVRAKGPVRMGRAAGADVERLLMDYGLKSLYGNGDMDLTARFDLDDLDSWEASGSFVMASIRAKSHPAGVVLDNLRGRVKFSRKKSMEITVEDISAEINQASIRLDGMFSQSKKGQKVVDAKAQTEGLDLEDLVALVPPLEETGLAGKLDMAVDIHYPYAHPNKIRLQGMVKARGVGIQLADKGVTVKEGDADLELGGKVIKVKGMTLLVNEQKVALSGQVSNPLRPKVWLHVKSPNLNVDRLLAPIKGEKPSRKEGTKIKGGKRPKDKAGDTELPPLIRDLTAQVQVEVGQGHYRGQEFQNLKLKVDYEAGVLKACDMAFGIGNGQIQTKGSADLRNLAHVTFALDPAVSNVPLESIAPLLSVDKLPIEGPLTVGGRLQGRTGSTTELLGSLRGNLDAEMGAGRIVKIDGGGELLVKMLSLASAKGILFERLGKDLSGKGMAFEKIKAQALIEGGNMDVKELLLRSDSLNIDTHGTVDLVGQQLDMETVLEPLVVLDDTFRMVPLVGKLAEDLTKIYLELKGSIEDPKIRMVEAKGIVTETVDETEALPRSVGKELEKVFGE